MHVILKAGFILLATVVLKVIAVTAVKAEERPPKPASVNPPRLDRHGDALPPGAVARLGTVRFRHPSIVSGLGFTPDGKILATGCFDGRVRIWDAGTGRQLRYLDRPPSVTSILLGLIVSPKPAPPEVYALAVSADGRSVVGAYNDGVICLWELATGRLRRTFSGQSLVRSLSFSSDGKTIASASDDRTVRLWDAATGRESHCLHSPGKVPQWSVAFSPDGKTVATGGDHGELYLWEVASGRRLRRCRGHESVVHSVCFSPDGKTLASGGSDRIIRLWDPATGDLRSQLPHLEKQVASVFFSPDGKMLAGVDGNGQIRLWETSTLRERGGIRVNWNVPLMVFAPDRKSLVLGVGGSIERWDIATRRRLLPAAGHSYAVSALAFSPDGTTLASGSYDRMVGLWDVADSRPPRLLAGHTGEIHAVRFAPQGKYLASAGSDTAIRIWDLSTGRVVHQLTGSAEYVYFDVAFSPDARTLAVQGADRVAHLWDFVSGQEVCSLPGTQDAIFSLDFSPDGKHLACAGLLPQQSDGSRKSNIVIWNVAQRHETRVLEGHQDFVTRVAYSVTGRVLVSGSTDGTIRVWETATSAERWRMHVSREEAPVFALSPDGRWLAVNEGNDGICLWDVYARRERGRFKSDQVGIRCLVFSPDGKLLASGGWDSTILLWDAAGGEK